MPIRYIHPLSIVSTLETWPLNQWHAVPFCPSQNTCHTVPVSGSCSLVKRSIANFQQGEFDLLIIGGGISGAAIAWEAILRGYRTALIEMKDFGHATSSATSKMIHGGLRYLAQGDIAVVRESLRERRYLEANLSAQAFPLPFLFPVYRNSPTPRWKLGVGLTLYDILSFDRNDLADSEKHLDSHRWIPREKVLSIEPSLPSENLLGAYHYYDVLNRHPERSNFDFIDSAERSGAVVANYLQAVSLLRHPDHSGVIVGALARDLLNPESPSFEIRARAVVNATGPWGESILRDMGVEPPRKIVRSKGIHLLFRRKHGNKALAVETRDGRHLFILPWGNHTLIGTTDTPCSEDPAESYVTEKEAQDFLDTINENLPWNLTLRDIEFAYSGIRPLVSTGEASTYRVSRRHEIVDHGKHRLKGLYSVFGGKWTTSRSLAAQAVDIITRRTGMARSNSLSKNTPLLSSRFSGPVSAFVESAIQSHPGFAPDMIRHLIEFYGAKYTEVLEFLQDEESRLPLLDFFPTTRGEISYAVQHEMVFTLEDFIMRRSGLGQEKFLTSDEAHSVAAAMALFTGWTPYQANEQAEKYLIRWKLRK